MANTMMPDKDKAKTVTNIHSPVVDIDSPQNINAFIGMFGGSPVSVLQESRFKLPAPVVNKRLSTDHVEPEQALSKDSSDSETAQSATPPTGVLPPPTTPVTTAVSPKKLKALNLDPVDENDPLILAKLADPNSSLADSKYAPTKQRVATPYPSSMMPTPPRGQETGSIDRLRLDRLMHNHLLTQVQQDILDRKARRNNLPTPSAANSKQTVVAKTSPPIATFENDVVAKFKAQAEARVKDKENAKVTDNTGALMLNDTEPFPAFEDDSDELAIKSPPSTPASMTGGALSVTATSGSLSPQAMEFIPSSPTAIQSPVKDEAKKEVAEVAYEAQAVLDNDKAELAFKTGHLSISQKEPGWLEGPTIIVTDSEDPAVRGNATHFTSWSTPQARDTVSANVRKVILRGLPVATDLTLLQSLIYGGTIDTFALGVNGTASVTFTTSEACDAYYAKYPNGMTFKYKGKGYVVYVEKGKDVDVVSGMLRGHLECGASRCVRATGADEDWGMKALLKLAEGKTRVGKVEHIGDVWRNQIRTIIFRFTSITDAVTFKAMLIRNEDWEGCNIQFMDDPCEKATGLHLE